MALGVNLEPFSAFAEFVAETKSKYTGFDIAGNPKPYVPLSELKKYWTVQRISKVLHAFSERLDLSADLIKRGYLGIFSTLVYTHHDDLNLLARLFFRHNLVDDKLPLRRRPSEWPDEPFHRNFFSRFAENQWLFFPLPFDADRLYDRDIDDRCVLPITLGDQIAHGSAADIYRFDIHLEYNRIGLDIKTKRLVAETFVLKIYHNKKYEGFYTNELRALQRLSSRSSPNLVKFHGSFRQLGSYCLILEYADGGDLGKFFDKCNPPSAVEDVALFWRSLFQVFSGLDRIHQLMSYNDDELIRGIHEDIRPENILVMKGPSGSPYDFTPKIADFGLYSRVRTIKGRSGGAMGLDHYGNQRFSSPECCHHTIQRNKGTNMINTKADIFSMGAVLSHTAAWVVGGPEEQITYFKLRQAYHLENIPRFIDSGYEGCFHNSIKPLPVVEQEHRKLRERCHVLDDITPKVLHWVEKYMLVQSPKDRSLAKNLEEKFAQFMDRRFLATPSMPPPSGGTELTVQSSLWSEMGSPQSTLDGVSPGSPPLPDATFPGVGLGLGCRPSMPGSPCPPQLPQDDPEPIVRDVHHSNPDRPSPGSSLQPRQVAVSQRTSSSSSPKIGVSQINQYKSAMRQGEAADQETTRLVDYLEHNFGGRDQFFFIDDSFTMADDKTKISDGFKALACIAKKLDPNQVELAFASRPRKVFRARRTRRLHDLVTTCSYQGDGHLMEGRLGELIDNVLIPRLPYKILGVNVNPLARKKVSVYVFTDGNWGHVDNSADACGVERPVRRLIEELKKRRLDRTQVSLHFVRFGKEENGRRHLERLDDCGLEDGWDIVDVKHIETEVRGMMIGPLTRSNDDIPAG